MDPASLTDFIVTVLYVVFTDFSFYYYGTVYATLQLQEQIKSYLNIIFRLIT